MTEARMSSMSCSGLASRLASGSVSRVGRGDGRGSCIWRHPSDCDSAGWPRGCGVTAGCSRLVIAVWLFATSELEVEITSLTARRPGVSFPRTQSSHGIFQSDKGHIRAWVHWPLRRSGIAREPAGRRGGLGSARGRAPVSRARVDVVAGSGRRVVAPQCRGLGSTSWRARVGAWSCPQRDWNMP